VEAVPMRVLGRLTRSNLNHVRPPLHAPHDKIARPDFWTLSQRTPAATLGHDRSNSRVTRQGKPVIARRHQALSREHNHHAQHPQQSASRHVAGENPGAHSSFGPC
jgi:hypothetical protein